MRLNPFLRLTHPLAGRSNGFTGHRLGGRVITVVAIASSVAVAAAAGCAHDRSDDARSAAAELTSVRAPASTPPGDQARVPTQPPAADVRAELEAAQGKKAGLDTNGGGDAGAFAEAGTASTSTVADAGLGTTGSGTTSSGTTTTTPTGSIMPRPTTTATTQTTPVAPHMTPSPATPTPR